MKTSAKGISLIKKYEGFRLTVYKCPANILTIGYGHTKTAVPGMSINKELAELLLNTDLIDFENAVRRLVKVPLTQSQFDSLVSFSFNVGVVSLSKSTLLRKLNLSDYAGAAEEFIKWNKARTTGGMKELPGLTKRRKEEQALFLSKN